MRVSSRFAPANGSENENQNSASDTASVDAGVELAALVDEPRDRLREHERRRRGRDQQQRDLPHAGAARAAQAVEVAAGGEAADSAGNSTVATATENIALREHVDAERASIARGASSVTSEPSDRVDQQVEVDQPEADRHRQHQPQDLADARVAPVRRRSCSWKPTRRSTGRHITSCTTVPGEHADRVRVELVRALEQRLQRDQHDDDHEVPDQRRDRRDREVVVGVEDPDDEPVEPEQHHDREQHAATARRSARRAPA